MKNFNESLLKTFLPILFSGILSGFVGYYFSLLSNKRRSLTYITKLTNLNIRRRLYIFILFFIDILLGIFTIILFYYKHFDWFFNSLGTTLFVASILILLNTFKNVGVLHFPYFEKNGLRLYILKELENDRVLVCKSNKVDLKNDIYPKEIEIVKITDFEAKPLKYGPLKYVPKDSE